MIYECRRIPGSAIRGLFEKPPSLLPPAPVASENRELELQRHRPVWCAEQPFTAGAAVAGKIEPQDSDIVTLAMHAIHDRVPSAAGLGPLTGFIMVGVVLEWLILAKSHPPQ
jgi:hypothetical protein